MRKKGEEMKKKGEKMRELGKKKVNSGKGKKAARIWALLGRAASPLFSPFFSSFLHLFFHIFSPLIFSATPCNINLGIYLEFHRLFRRIF